MKVIIAGGRNITDPSLLTAAVHDSEFEITEIVHGGARGVDEMADRFAQHRGVPCRIFAGDWAGFGLSAGPRRNTEMAEYADALILIWDGKSRGSADMLRKAKAKGLKIYQLIIEV